MRAQLTREILSVDVNEHLRLVAIRRYPPDQFCGLRQLICVQGRMRKKLLQIDPFRPIAMNQSNLIDDGLRTALAQYAGNTSSRSNPTVSNDLWQQTPQPFLSF